jgi:hypothetical protein
MPISPGLGLGGTDHKKICVENDSKEHYKSSKTLSRPSSTERTPGHPTGLADFTFGADGRAP